MRRLKNQAFTLVELIVVITILAILGTIGFISLQGYSVSARESARISDLATIQRSLEFFQTIEGYYPDPTDFITISYSGSLAWKQGVFWDDTRNIVTRISEVPTDPLLGTPYAYSTTNTRSEYELGAISESPLLSFNPITNQANAINSYYTNIVGNYNKQVVAVKQSNYLYILWVPTIITSEITDVTVEQILANQSFSIKNSKSLPWNYSSYLPEWQTIKEWNSFTPGTMTWTIAPVLYQGALTTLSDNSTKQTFWENIISYYLNSNIWDTWSYDNLRNESGNEVAVVDLILSNDRNGIGGKNLVSTNSSSPVNFCLDPANIWTRWISWKCLNLLIVDNDLLQDVAYSEAYGWPSYPPVVVDGITYSTAQPNGVYTGQVTNMSYLLWGTYYNWDVWYWDTSNVTNMDGLFSWARTFNQDISWWDVSKVTSMSETFKQASEFNQDLWNWDVSNVTNMFKTFKWTDKFNQDISRWNTSKVTNMGGMFSNQSFNQDISTHEVTGKDGVKYMAWDVSNVTDIYSMFLWNPVFDQNISNWNTSKVTDMSYLFNGALNFWASISKWPSSPTASWTIADWDTSKVTNMILMFSAANEFNQNIWNWNTSNVTSMAHMFKNNTKFDQDISLWKTAKVTDMTYMFSGANKFNQNLSSWCVSLIPSKPSNFDTTTTAWVKTNRQPVWWTCPAL